VRISWHHRWVRITSAALASIVALFLVGDRMAAAVAERRIGERIACRFELVGSPAVSLGGFPFLTQIPSGRYDSVRVTALDVRRGNLTASRVEAILRDLTLPGGGRPIHVGEVDLTATVAYDTLPTAAGGRTLAYSPAGNGTLAITTETAIAGRRIPVTVIVEPQLDSGRLGFTPREVEVLGVRRPAGDLLDRLGLKTDLGRDLPSLPAGLTYRSATAADDGLRITLAGAGLETNASAGTGHCGGSR
jgi:hypothetical protein